MCNFPNFLLCIHCFFAISAFCLLTSCISVFLYICAVYVQFVLVFKYIASLFSSWRPNLIINHRMSNVPLLKVCNGVEDCSDGSDEVQVPGGCIFNLTCSAEEFKCASARQCVSRQNYFTGPIDFVSCTHIRPKCCCSVVGVKHCLTFL